MENHHSSRSHTGNDDSITAVPTAETEALRRSTSRSVSSATSASLRSSGANHQKTLSFFKTLIGKRSTDYHGDAPQPTALSRGRSNSLYGSSNRNSGATNQYATSERAAPGDALGGSGEAPAPRWWNNCWRRLVIPAETHKAFCSRVIKHRIWNSVLILFTITLVFGAQLRDLLFAPPADDYFDYIFLAIIGFFTVDIAMRMNAEPNYFACRAFGRGRLNMEDSTTCWDFQLGSFVFWCEVISTVALLHDISLVRQDEFDQQEIAITLNQFGAPADGMRAVNEASPVEYREIDLLVVIAKTARIARFIRSSTAVKISAKVNWYWCFNLLNPFWWCRSCVARKEKDDDDNSPDAARPGIQGRNASMPLMRRSSGWGIVGLGAVAAARAKKEEEEENKAHPFLRLLRNMGILNNKDRELKRQVAALKIQRAWRIVLAQRYLDDEGEGYETGGDNSNHDLNWRGRSSASISTRGQSPGPLSRSNNFNNLVPIRRVDPRLPTNEIRKRKESQVGSAMRELTGQRVAIGILVALVVTVLFTYTENDATRPATMIVLHAQTRNPNYAQRSLDAARASSIPDLFSYQYANGTIQEFLVGDTPDQELRPREILRISVEDSTGLIKTVGLFAYRSELKQEALVHLLSSIFIILIWFFGVTGFAGPVMILVVIPIERMVSLLEMLMRDPLGYQNSARYKKFLSEEKEITKNTRWTKEVLKGMETSFLMHTILRIGSLMKVGFGSAGVEIIRNNLEGKNKSMLTLSGKGSTVSCIFLFCDIRQFTDATECLQEEVFVFTNKIAAVVHSICNSYGGSANKNIGDAFLLSWRLDDEAEDDRGPFRTKSSGFQAKSNQADKALLSVVKICMALHYDDYYLETMSDAAREALLAKLSKRKGPVVQLGFGLHAGKAVQGSIGSQRKIDATYVSEAVERAEFLESSTKQYGVKMLMSHDFHRLLHPNNRRRCRKIDQILIKNDDDDGDEDYINGDTMDLYTFDMDIDALWRRTALTTSNRMKMEIESDSGESNEKAVSKRDLRTPASTRQMLGRRRPSVRHNNLLVDESSEIGIGGGPSNSQGDLIGDQEVGMPAKLVLPTGPALYNAKVWVDRNMHEIRRAYTDGIFLQKFNAGLQSFYSKDWERAKQCFTTCMEKIEDGPSRYFLDQIEKHDGKPPRNFLGYGIA